MFVGHAFVAFAVAAVAAHRLGWPRERALAVGAVAGGFATVPDVDMIYAPVGVFWASTVDPAAVVEGFWTASRHTHRTVTHSLVVAPVAAAGFALAGAHRRIAAALLGGIVAVVAATTGPLATVIATVFVSVGAGVGVAAARRGLTPRVVGAAALVGLWTHPFGDLLTGGPPRLLYPLDATVFADRVSLFADPTLNLLAPFALELGALWLGVAACAWLTGHRLRDHVGVRACVGAAYAGAAFVVPAPSLSVPHEFVFGVLATGLVGVAPVRGRDGTRLPVELSASTVVTALATVTVAGAAYTAAYLVASA